MTVYLVGAGPGDPGLLTVRGAELLSAAEVIVHDRLAESRLLDLAPAKAERHDVGKTPGGPVDQESINRLLVEKGRAGLRVVRLKGGDPFVFGRGGEEALALQKAGVAFEVVPGIPSAVAAPAYAGVPVTHRGLATSFTVVTGHSRAKADRPTDWEALAQAGGTIIILMGVAHRGQIAERLIAGGLPPDTPVAAVRWGTRPEQTSVRTTLRSLGSTPLEPPATIVVGGVAGLDLAWYERLPLFGRRIVVTRPLVDHGAAPKIGPLTPASAGGHKDPAPASAGRPQDPAPASAGEDGRASLASRLRVLGAEPIELPAMRLVPPADGGEALAGAARRLAEGKYSWVVFTSANAVGRLTAHLHDVRDFVGPAGPARIAAIGPGTAGALANWSLKADLVPKKFVAEGLRAEFPKPSKPGQRVLLPRAAVARDVLPEGLREMGWEVDVVETYRTEAVTHPGEAYTEAAQADAICFTSAATVTNYLAGAGGKKLPRMVACIGPITAEAAREAGIADPVVAERHDLDGLIAVLVEALGAAPKQES